MIFMGVLFKKDDEKHILSHSKSGVSNAVNLFQWNVIEGLCENDVKLNIINALPVGTWPKSYDCLYLDSKEWEYNKQPCYEIGTLNIPFIKQFVRATKAKKIIKKLSRQDKEVIIYSAYMPYLKAVYKLPRDVKVSVIITDLPEYYDLAQCSQTRKLLRKMQNKLVYRYMKRIDRFVLLTEQMKEPLGVGDRPYTVIEGICSTQSCVTHVRKDDKKIIFYSGTLNYKYGIKNLLEAFSLIQDSDTELWICGSGEAKSDIEKMCERDKRVHFFGFLPLDEVASLRCRASVLVNPRTNDEEYTKYSFPSKTMEYMTSGIPLVMYKLDGIPDEYDDYIVYVKDNSVTTLKDTLVNILEMPESQRNYLANKARDFVLGKKNRNVQAKKITKLFEV